MRVEENPYGQVSSTIESLLNTISRYIKRSELSPEDPEFKILENLSNALKIQKTFHGILWHLYRARSLLEPKNRGDRLLNIIISNSQSQMAFQVEAAERDSFGNNLEAARFETFLALAILNNASTLGLFKINLAIIEYLDRHQQTIEDLHKKSLRASLLEYKLCDESQLYTDSALEIFRRLLSRPLDHPLIISECITLHLIFFNYKNIFDPKLDNPLAENQRAQRGKMFEAGTRGRIRKEFTKPSREFGITDVERLPEWAKEWNRVSATPFKYRVNKNNNSAIVQTFSQHNIPFIAGPSGTAFDIVSGLALLAPNISKEEEREYFNLLAAAEVAMGHHSFLEVLLPLLGMGYFPEILGPEASETQALWERVDYQFAYIKFLSPSFKETPAFKELLVDYPQYLEVEAITSPISKMAENAQKLWQSSLKVQRFFRANLAHDYMKGGPYWSGLQTEKNPHQNFRELSRKNLLKMRLELGQLSRDDRAFFRAFCSQSFDLTHYTQGAEAISNNGALLSKMDLEKLKIGHKSSSAADDAQIRNGGFVFFRFEVVHDKRKTSRFGNQAFVLKARESDLFDHGWVSMYEMLKPDTASVARELKYKNRIVRECRTTHFDNKQILFDYSETGQKHSFDLVETLFYGQDILIGIGLAMIRELRRIGGEFQRDALQGLDCLSLNHTLSQVFRVEAKIPSRVLLASLPWQLFISTQQNFPYGKETSTKSNYQNISHKNKHDNFINKNNKYNINRYIDIVKIETPLSNYSAAPQSTFESKINTLYGKFDKKIPSLPLANLSIFPEHIKKNDFKLEPYKQVSYSQNIALLLSKAPKPLLSALINQLARLLAEWPYVEEKEKLMQELKKYLDSDPQENPTEFRIL